MNREVLLDTSAINHYYRQKHYAVAKTVGFKRAGPEFQVVVRKSLKQPKSLIFCTVSDFCAGTLWGFEDVFMPLPVAEGATNAGAAQFVEIAESSRSHLLWFFG